MSLLETGLDETDPDLDESAQDLDDLTGDPSGELDGTSGPSLDLAWTAVFAVSGMVIGLQALADNSFLTHLTTGRWILDNGAVPRSDPYTFTSAGEPWIAQSWLASVFYGAADAIGGGAGLRVFTALITAALGALAWRLSRPARSLLPRLALSATTVVIGVMMWSERPLIIGLLAFALALVMVEDDRFDLRLFVPLMWVWVNSHGSYPLVLVAIGCLMVGRLLDGNGTGRELDALKWAGIGTLIGGILNPYGPKMLLFPIELLQRQDLLRNIIEWQSPDFSLLFARMFLALLALGLAALVRRPTFRSALPMFVFVAAALMGTRNLTLASLVIVVAAAPGLEGLGSLTTVGRSHRAGLTLVGCLAVAGVLSAVTLTSDHYDLSAYPEPTIDWLEEQGVFANDTAMLHTDVVGNYLTQRYDGEYGIFIDDRFELHPRVLIEDYLTLARGMPDWDEALDRWEIEVIMWPSASPLAELISYEDEWQVVFEDENDEGEAVWLVACRRGTPLCADL